MQLQEFKFNDNQIRVIEKDGEPWFVARDVAEVLDIKNYRDTLTNYPEEEKGVATTDTLGGKQTVSIISEAGLYRMIFQSRKENAEKFKTWVFSQVLPRIRKTGYYSKPKSLEEISLLAITGLTAKIEEQKRALLEAQPKIEFFDVVTGQDSRSYGMSEAVKLLNLSIGRNNFYALLKSNKILQNDREPYQQYLDSDYFRLILKQVAHGGTEKVVLVTGKGLAWLQKKYAYLTKENL